MLRFLRLLCLHPSRRSSGLSPPAPRVSNSPPPDRSPFACPSSTNPSEQFARRQKLEKLQQMGIDPWGGRFDDHQPIGAIRAREGEITVVPAAEPVAPAVATGTSAATANPARQAAPELRGPRVRAAGRIVLMRDTGKLIWINLKDWTGEIQLYLGKKQVGEQSWEVAQCLDLGDVIGVDGELKRTRTGELTIFVDQLHFLTKALDPPPDKHHGLADPELRQRMRYLDLIHTDGVLERFRRRTQIVQSIRHTLAEAGFAEIEGPTLHSIAGGAAARPFITHHNALDIKLFLRIALELHLKRLLVGGIERVFELGRVYRNEGISPRHNPEFTMLEAYQAYGDYRSMMDLTERLIVDAIRATGQPEQLSLERAARSISLKPPFARRTYDELFAEATGIAADDAAAIKMLAESIGFATAGKHPDVIKSEVFEQRVEDQLVGPIFVIDYPQPASVRLTKRKPRQSGRGRTIRVVRARDGSGECLYRTE